MYFLIIEVNYFRGDLRDISAKTATLTVSHGIFKTGVIMFLRAVVLDLSSFLDLALTH